MDTTLTMNAKEQKLSLAVDLKSGRLGEKLSAAEAENVVMHLEKMFRKAGREVFKEWLTGFESDADILVIDGQSGGGRPGAVSKNGSDVIVLLGWVGSGDSFVGVLFERI